MKTQSSILSLSLSLSLILTIRTFWGIKEKEKKQKIFLYRNVVVFSVLSAWTMFRISLSFTFVHSWKWEVTCLCLPTQDSLTMSLVLCSLNGSFGSLFLSRLLQIEVSLHLASLNVSFCEDLIYRLPDIKLVGISDHSWRYLFFLPFHNLLRCWWNVICCYQSH